MKEQDLYARWLDFGTRIAFVALLLSFCAYVLGLIDPLVPHQELTRLWLLPVDRYIAATGAPTGWGWLGLLGKGDYLNFIGVATLATITIVCYARIIPILVREGQTWRAAIAVAQIVVLLAAALY